MPADTLSGLGGIASWAASDANAWKNSLGQGMANAGAGIGLFGTSTKQTAAQQLAIINDHTQQITELRAEFNQDTIWGTARTSQVTQLTMQARGLCAPKL